MSIYPSSFSRSGWKRSCRRTRGISEALARFDLLKYGDDCSSMARIFIAVALHEPHIDFIPIPGARVNPFGKEGYLRQGATRLRSFKSTVFGQLLGHFDCHRRLDTLVMGSYTQMTSYARVIPMENCGGGVRWLHLTDLHVGKVNGSQTNALEALLSSLQSEVADQRFDMVLLTGDIAYSGSDAEYTEFEKTLLEPMRAMDAFHGAEFICVPGNHDLDCSEGTPLNWDTLGKGRQEIFFDDSAQAKKIRAGRGAGFRAYTDFARRNAIFTVDPTSEVAVKREFSFDGGNLTLILTASCFFSDYEISDQNKAPAPVPAVRPLLKGNNNSKVLVLGHHPLSWFSYESANRYKSLLSEGRAIYLNGHEHRLTAEFDGRGLLSIGFGAAYQESPDRTGQAAYQNSYAICYLDDFLHVKVIGWESVHGKWRASTSLPYQFEDASEVLQGGYRLVLPATRATVASTAYSSLAATLQQAISMDRCVWLAKDSAARWSEILVTLGLFNEVKDFYVLAPNESRPGIQQFRLKDGRGDHLIYAVDATGSIITYDQLQALNTELDTEAYEGCVVATFGTIAGDALNLAARLKTKKRIDVLERQNIIKRLIRKLNKNLQYEVGNVDPAEVEQWIMVTDSDVGIVRVQRTTRDWFEILNADAEILDEANPLVLKIRSEFPELAVARYRKPSLPEALAATHGSDSGFDKNLYLEQNYLYFDDVKYAPLAALGLRFRNASLSEIYVNASADANGSVRNEEAVARAVEEFVETLHLPPSQRDQLEAQLRARLSSPQRTEEVGAARQLYQRYSNVIVLGDPGSGKTCFVKSEILAYCKPPELNGSWYSNHLPIYLSLSEAARLVGDTVNLPELCETVSARRGIHLPQAEVLKALSDGYAAFFFDGLDEVGSLEKRSELMGAISSLIEQQSARGNRFVIASRPAAAQSITLPKELKYLHLKGLTEDEMKLLAGRVLTVRLGENEEQSLSDDEASLVDRLVEDTRQSPGIARIARNPLLLTLLVLIYANTGTLSAKRHLIYTQAIKTLVSVRGRDTRDEQLPESDLRVRLGALSVAIFDKEISEIPRRAEVNQILQPLVPGGAEAVDLFLQLVAESTGLLRVHRDEESVQNDLITFMHYSFLEYYAASGILNRGDLAVLDKIADSSRWKDVVTLLFGIMSEQSDVTPALRVLLTGGGANQSITGSRLLLALECAAECDVPPLASQALLAEQIFSSLETGAALVSGELRESIARKLGHFLSGGAGARFYEMLEAGLHHPNVVVRSAFADLVGYLPQEVRLPTKIQAAFVEFAKSLDPVSTVVALDSMRRRLDLRPPNAPHVLNACLSGNLVEKHSALRLCNAVPAYYAECSGLVEALLYDKNDFVSSDAAKCVLYCDTDLASRPSALREKLLAKLDLSDREDFDELAYVTLNMAQIEMMLNSHDPLESELAIRYTPLISDEADFVYKVLISRLKGDTGARIKAASMDALRASPRALDLVKIADIDLVCQLTAHVEKNVRIAAVRLLGEMPNDEQVQITLLERIDSLKRSSTKNSELVEVAKAVAKQAGRAQRLRKRIVAELDELLPVDAAFGDSSQQDRLVSLLQIVESFRGETSALVSGKLGRLFEDFRTPDSIRKQSLKTFGTLAETTVGNLERLTTIVERNDPLLNSAAYAALVAFLGQCKGSISAIRRIQSGLALLGPSIRRAWSREVGRSQGRIDTGAIRDLRQATADLDELILQYQEFAERARPVGSHPG